MTITTVNAPPASACIIRPAPDRAQPAAARYIPARPVPVRWTSPGAGIGIGAVLAVVAAAAMHLLTGPSSVDPVQETLSMYGAAPRTAGLFAVSCLALAVAVLCCTQRLPSVGQYAAYAAAVMLLIVVVFPTDTGVGPLSAVAQIHRYAAGAAFVLITVVLASAADRCAGPMRLVVRACLVPAVLMLSLTIAAVLWPDLLAMAQWRGIPQRVLLLSEAAGLIGVSICWRRPASGATGVGCVTPR